MRQSLRRKNDRSGLIVEVLRDARLSVFMPWQAINNLLATRLDESTKLQMSQEAKEELMHVLQILDRAYALYFQYIQMGNAKLLEEQERRYSPNVRDILRARITLAAAFDLNLWKHAHVSDSEHQAVLDEVRQAVSLARLEKTELGEQIKEQKRKELIRAQKMLSAGFDFDEEHALMMASDEVYQRFNANKGASKELERMETLFQLRSLDVQKEWGPRMKMIQRVIAIPEVLQPCVAKTVDEIAECARLLSADVALPDARHHEILQNGSQRITSDIMRFLRDALKACQGEHSLLSRDEENRFKIATRLRNTERTLVETHEKMNEANCDDHMADYKNAQIAAMGFEIQRDHMQRLAVVFQKTVHCAHTSLTAAADLELNDERRFPSGSEAVKKLAKMMDLLKQTQREVQAKAEQMNKSDELKDLRMQAWEALRSWMQAVESRDGTRYALFLIRQALTDPLRFADIFNAALVDINRRNSLPDGYVEARLKLYEEVFADCRKELKKQREEYATPILRILAGDVKNCVIAIHENLKVERNAILQTLQQTGVSLQAIGAMRVSHTMEAIAKQPFVLEIGGVGTSIVQAIRSLCETMRKIQASPSFDKYAGAALPATDIRALITELGDLEGTLINPRSKPTNLLTIWKQSVLLFLCSMLCEGFSDFLNE